MPTRLRRRGDDINDVVVNQLKSMYVTTKRDQIVNRGLVFVLSVYLINHINRLINLFGQRRSHDIVNPQLAVSLLHGDVRARGSVQDRPDNASKPSVCRAGQATPK